MTAQIVVRERGLGLLWLKLNVGPICNDSAAEGNICANTELCKCTLHSTFTIGGMEGLILGEQYNSLLKLGFYIKSFRV